MLAVKLSGRARCAAVLCGAMAVSLRGTVGGAAILRWLNSNLFFGHGVVADLHGSADCGVRVCA